MIRIAENLEWSLTYYVDHPEQSLEMLEGLFRDEPGKFVEQSLRLLDLAADTPGTVFLVSFLSRKGRLLEGLAAKAAMQFENAVKVANIALRVDGSFDHALAQNLLHERDDERRERLLAILCKIRLRPDVVQSLAGLIRDPNPRIHSKIALLLTRVDPEGAWVKDALADPDPRVRANVQEALWDRQTPFARSVFLRGLEDDARRVRTNAAYGLYLQGHPLALETAMRLLRSRDLLDQRAGLWLVEKSRDTRFQSTVARMVAKSESEARTRCLRVLRALKQREDQAHAAGELKLHVHRRVMPGGRVEILMECPRPFASLDFSAIQGEEPILDFEVELLEPIGKPSIAVVAPRGVDLGLEPAVKSPVFLFDPPLAASATAAPKTQRVRTAFRMLGVAMDQEVVEEEAVEAPSRPVDEPVLFENAFDAAVEFVTKDSRNAHVLFVRPPQLPASRGGAVVRLVEDPAALHDEMERIRFVSQANVRIRLESQRPQDPMVISIVSDNGFARMTLS